MMSDRNKKLQFVLIALGSVQRGEQTAEEALTRIVWAMLEPAERKLLAFVVQRGSVTSADVVEQFKVTQNYAATVLKRFSDLGLLEREACLIESGIGYRYTPAKGIASV